MATGMDAYEEAVSPVKAEILQHARNKGGGPQAVLEIGIGAAPNLQYLTSFEPVRHSLISITLIVLTSLPKFIFLRTLSEVL